MPEWASACIPVLLHCVGGRCEYVRLPRTSSVMMFTLNSGSEDVATPVVNVLLCYYPRGAEQLTQFSTTDPHSDSWRSVFGIWTFPWWYFCEILGGVPMKVAVSREVQKLRFWETTRRPNTNSKEKLHSQDSTEMVTHVRAVFSYILFGSLVTSQNTPHQLLPRSVGACRVQSSKWGGGQLLTQSWLSGMESLCTRGLEDTCFAACLIQKVGNYNFHQMLLSLSVTRISLLNNKEIPHLMVVRNPLRRSNNFSLPRQS